MAWLIYLSRAILSSFHLLDAEQGKINSPHTFILRINNCNVNSLRCSFGRPFRGCRLTWNSTGISARGRTRDGACNYA